jgi:MFS family permease
MVAPIDYRKVFMPSRLTLIGLLLASMLTLMGGAALAPALPTISEEFPQESEFVISLIVTLPSLAIALTGILLGVLADKYGKVRLLVISLVIFSVAGVSGFFQNDMTSILIGRFFVGVGIAGLTCSCTALLSEYYSGPVRMKILGYQAAAMGVGGLLLEVSGGVLAGIGWRFPFLIYGLGFGVMILVLASSREPTKAELPRGLEGETKRLDRPLVGLCLISIFLAMFLMFAIPTKLAYYISDIGGSPALIGVFLGVNGICSAVTSVLYRRLSGRLDVYAMLAAAFLLFTIGFMAFLLPPSLSVAFVGASCIGLAVGVALPTVTNTLAKESSQSTSGKIMGGFTMMFYFGQFLSSIILTPILAMTGSYSIMFVCLGGVAGVAVLVLILVGMKARRRTHDVPRTFTPNESYRKILLATDGSQNNLAAVEHSIVLARKINAEMTILCVRDTAPFLPSTLNAGDAIEVAVEDAGRASEEAVRKALVRCAAAQVPAHGLEFSGPAAEVIVAVSADYDLIVMGTLGRTGLAHAMIGSVAEEVVRSARCPVLVVPGGRTEQFKPVSNPLDSEIEERPMNQTRPSAECR